MYLARMILLMRKLRFSDVGDAIESTPKAFRKMLENPTMALPSIPQTGWTEFFLVQVAVLALSRRFIEFGFSVGSASTTACMILLEATAIDDGSPLTAGRFLDLLADSYAVVRVDAGELRTDIVHSAGWPKPKAADQDRAVLVVPAGKVVARAFQRAKVAAADDMSGSDSDLLQRLQKLFVQIETPRGDVVTVNDPQSSTKPKKRRVA